MKPILLIESDATLRAQIYKVLTFHNLTVEEATDGAQGLSQALNKEYELILCGVVIPKIHGFKLIEKLKSNRSKESIPFIFINGSKELPRIRLAMNLGADDYLSAPVAMEELVISIKARLHKKQNATAVISDKFKKEMMALKKKIYYNPATGLPNEQALLIRLEQRKKQKWIMLYIGISGLNEIRDFIGQESFQKIQEELVSRVNTCESDKAEFYQLKEDEFFLLGECTDGTTAECTHEKIVQHCKEIIRRVKEPMGSMGFELALCATIGVNITNVFGDDIFESFREAKIAKSYAMTMSESTYFFYNKSLREKYNKLAQTQLTKYINTDKKRAIYRENRDPKIRDNFEIKIFFLYPHSVLQQNLVQEIIGNEYAAYLLNDHIKAMELLKKYTNSILFINIDAHLSESEWDNYINNIMYDAQTQNVKIGILSFYNDKKKVEKYLLKMMVPCGFITLKQGMKECTEIILNALEANEAKGTRKYIRVRCRDMPSVSFSVTVNNKQVKGFIYDISSTGMACGFAKEEEVYLRKETKLSKIQLQLKGNVCLLEGQIAGINKDNDGNLKYVVMFKNVQHEEKKKMHQFIAKCLQKSIDDELEQITVTSEIPQIEELKSID